MATPGPSSACYLATTRLLLVISVLVIPNNEIIFLFANVPVERTQCKDLCIMNI